MVKRRDRPLMIETKHRATIRWGTCFCRKEEAVEAFRERFADYESPR
jgi:hypothetical protein